MSLLRTGPMDLPEGTRLNLTARSKGVEIEVDPGILRVVLQAPVFGFGPERVAALWHEPEPKPRLSFALTNTSDEPRLVRLFEATIDLRFEQSYARWVLGSRRREEDEGGAAAEAQDGVRADGSLALLLAPGERRIVEQEFEIPLAPGVEAARLLHEIDVSVEGVEPQRLTSMLMLTHPPSRLLSMLPALYREAMADLREDMTPPETPFFERYLTGVQDVIDPLREALRRLDALFGAYTTPPDMLLYLASWVCMPLDENWPEMKRRKLVQEAAELFRWRGTAHGLRRFLRIYTGIDPVIQDQPQPGVRLGPETCIGEPGVVIGDIPPHTFTVTISHPAPENLDERVIHGIIESEKPAHTAYRLMIVRREAYQPS